MSIATAKRIEVSELQRFASLITEVHESEIAADVTLGGRLLLAQQQPLAISYAPFEHIQHGARIAIVGITPGAQQARNALGELRRQLIAGADHGTALGAAKTFASFSGSMRANLVAMLDYIGLAGWMGLGSTAELWTSRSDLVHFTSAIRYPVFINGENYSGSPSMVTTPLLREAILQYLAEEVFALPNAVWVPLGPKVSEGLALLVKRGLLSPDRLLIGLPHPSGANAERISYFLGRKGRASLSAKTSSDTIDAHRAALFDLTGNLPR
ncbi:hypothetical protein [Bradyrhizobium sp. BRP56]|uniref:hypothetical protein n=1 Tax=Bradyrhizobium sp. BRP56 TaxID=2793819 RepID=UPI001CD59D61|nr:hypothetical protein [Bradyrhizobium sp. BRP56]MCA1397461.1 hypothetical protein [Bradyrhizobium sp. BRP56]